MDEEVKFRPVYQTFNKGTIAFIKSLLENNEIIYYVDNEHAAGVATGDVSGMMTVMVANEQVKIVEELLKEVQG